MTRMNPPRLVRHVSMLAITVLALLVLAPLAAAQPAAPATQPGGRGGRGGRGGPQGPQVTSPEVTADRHVTFRIVAPKAEAVRLAAGDIPGGQAGAGATVGLIDGTFRANLEETGMSYRLEVECIAAAHELDLLTTPYAFNEEEARLMTGAGADVVVAHMGLTTSGRIGARTALTLDEAVGRTRAIAEACRSVRPECLVLCHGGPIAEPKDAQYVLDRCAIDGFYGASSMERLPAERAITRQVEQFTAMKLSRRDGV